MAGEVSPPPGLTPPQQALWWLERGGLSLGPEWEKAHAICQSNEGDPAHDLVHALAHLIEGDLGNSDYWYRRSGDAPVSRDPHAEWRRIADRLGGPARQD
ncbi:hypothetical protein [Frigidibacter sp. ROC022]|uniref:hypothetical protein n=1 Tax=Frigidibacter sp. ROC022 TaxID=2971796 RepID=UPI00215A1D46|nr:hypothetical protein [Frigidibacter sp. ROC022]MCR8725368.1 hypothetical protein [Frigidibacter sp. ROC022]